MGNPSARPAARRQASIEMAARAHPGVVVESYRYSVGAVEPLERHVHVTWQLTWSPDAVGEHWMRAGLCETPPLALGIIPPGEVHAPSQRTWLPAVESYMTAYLDDELFAAAASELSGPRGTPSFGVHGTGVIRGDAHLSRLFVGAHAASFAGEPLERETGWLAVMTHLLTAHGDRRVPRDRREPRAVAAALDHLHARPYERVTLAELAGAAGITPARLCRAFASAVGLPPHAYQLRLRIERARELLLRGQPVAHVAAVTGFADQSHLGRHFRRIVGATPARYRAARA